MNAEREPPASDASRYTTGNTLFVDGGSHIDGSVWAPELPEERITAESVVETAHAVACGPKAAADPRAWRERWAEYLHASSFVPDLPEYASIPHEVTSELPADEFLAALQELSATLKRDFRYVTGTTDVNSGPDVFFEKGGGVCQDFSHATLGILRLAGVPSRYASGYLYDPASAGAASDLRGAAASHAWVQAWHPEIGWVGLDPTNDKLVDWQYVRIAIGRDYGDVRPMRGVFRGETEQRHSVSVEVTRLDRSHRVPLT
jgi:transglutaminase-like putative cysteine protease